MCLIDWRRCLNFTRKHDSSLVLIKWPYHLQTEAIVRILYFKQIFFSPLPDSFSLVLKHRNSVHFKILIYNRTHALAVNVDRVSPLPVVGDFLFWLVIFFGLVLSLKLQIDLSGIHWLRISESHLTLFEVSMREQGQRRLQARKEWPRTDSIHINYKCVCEIV